MPGFDPNVPCGRVPLTCRSGLALLGRFDDVDFREEDMVGAENTEG